jgi:hypothetical protein
MRKLQSFILLVSISMTACHSKQDAAAEDQEPTVITPVTITSIRRENMVEYVDLNATSAFLLKGIVKANSNGYLQASHIQPGKLVSSGETVFTLKTKEAQSIGNTINLLDTTFRFSGIINIKAGTTGYVSEVDHEPGDFVQEGEQLAVINDRNSFAFILNLPYELRPYILNKETAELLLPDGTTMTGRISSVMPVVDSMSQTQNVLIKVSQQNLPLNLIAKVRVVKQMKENTVSLPKQTVLSDETQTDFWVMKLIDSSTAIKVPVVKGMVLSDRVEILSPVFSATDRFLLTGNYGLADTTKIKIIRE